MAVGVLLALDIPLLAIVFTCVALEIDFVDPLLISYEITLGVSQSILRSTPT
jgi:Na+/H+ antiporter NhaC